MKIGHPFPVEITCIPVIIDNKFVGVQGITRDITEKKNAEKALRESEEKYKAIFNNVQVALFRTRISDGKLVEINERYANMAGYSNVEDCMAEFNAADAWADPNARSELLRILKEKGSVNDYETEIIRRDGSAIWIVFSATMFPEQDFLEGSIVDINERKQAEEALRESEAHKQALLDGTPDMIIQIDTNMKVLWANSVALTVKPDIVGMTCYKGFINKDNPCEDCACNRAIETGNIESSIMYHPAAEGVQGESYWDLIGVPLKNNAGEITGAIEIARNITDQKQMENVLRQSEAEKKAILNGISTSMRLVNENLETIWANKAAADSANKSPEEMVGHKCYEFWGDDPEKPCDGCPSVKSFRTKKTEQTVRHDQDGIIWDLKAEPVFDEKGNLAGVVEIANDITDKTRFETRLQQAQKMESIGTLAGGIAHNFNNLLMGIQGNASMALLDIDSSNPRHKNLTNIEKLVENGAKLTAQLIGYAREGSYEVKPTSLNQLVKETSDTFGMTKKEITVHQELSEKLYGIKADQGQIEQVLLNLYVNAADAMPEGGDLFLKTINVTDKDITGKPYKVQPGNYVLLTVRDTGIGMDKKTTERVFEPFFTTKGLASGTGLGTASAYGTIKGHGGYIDVDSEKGKGTTFSIYLPATEKVIEEKEVLSDELVKGKGTVLLVDDEEMVLEAGKELLDHLGYEVLLAENGREALELYKKNLDKIDLVLLDMVMPVMGGGEAFDRMKEINTNVKVLLSSGYSLEGEAKEILKRGCNAFIQKPFKMEQLSQKLMEVLDKK